MYQISTPAVLQLALFSSETSYMTNNNDDVLNDLYEPLLELLNCNILCSKSPEELDHHFSKILQFFFETLPNNSNLKSEEVLCKAFENLKDAILLVSNPISEGYDYVTLNDRIDTILEVANKLTTQGWNLTPQYKKLLLVRAILGIAFKGFKSNSEKLYTFNIFGEVSDLILKEPQPDERISQFLLSTFFHIIESNKDSKIEDLNLLIEYNHLLMKIHKISKSISLLPNYSESISLQKDMTALRLYKWKLESAG
jgi:hypothetical protein